jgi:hypothetical protein
MKRFGIGLLYAIAAYVVFALIGYFLMLQLSSNTHDRGVEAAMTSAFVFGPIAGIIAFIAGIARSGGSAKAIEE